MSFFMRAGGKGKRGGKGGFVARDTTKHKRRRKEEAKLQNVEISSEEEEEVRGGRVEEEEGGEEEVSAQDKKVLLAKKYLAYLEEGAEGERKGGVISKLNEELLEESGKGKKRGVAEGVRDAVVDAPQVRVLRSKRQRKAITCAAVTPDSRSLFAGSKDGVIVKWELGEGSGGAVAASERGACDGGLLALAVSHDARHLASGDEGSFVVRLWDPSTLRPTFQFKGHRGPVTGLAFCRLTSALYSASRDRTLKVWSIEERAYVETLFGHQTPITALDLLAKDRLITSGGADYSLRLWKIPEESQLIFNAPPASVDSVRRLDNKHFVSVSDGGELSVWGVWRKKPLVTVSHAHGKDEASGEPRWLVSVAAVPNSDLVASGSSDGALRLWKVEEGAKALTPLAHIPLKGFINALLFTPDEKYLVAGVGQEHRFGRWSVIKEATNALHVITIQR